MNHQTRPLPKSTIIAIIIICSLAFIAFIVLKVLKEEKITEILSTLGHTNIQSVEVINKLDVEDEITKKRSKVFKVAFYDNDLQKYCIGFLHHQENNIYTKDLDCK